MRLLTVLLFNCFALHFRVDLATPDPRAHLVRTAPRAQQERTVNPAASVLQERGYVSTDEVLLSLVCLPALPLPPMHFSGNLIGAYSIM